MDWKTTESVFHSPEGRKGRLCYLCHHAQTSFVVYAASHPIGSADTAGRVCLIQTRAVLPQDAQSSEWAVVQIFTFYWHLAIVWAIIMIHTDLKNYDISCTYIFHDIYCNSELSRMLYCMVYTLHNFHHSGTSFYVIIYPWNTCLWPLKLPNFHCG